jgi:AcrR family transcriptional regulator
MSPRLPVRPLTTPRSRRPGRPPVADAPTSGERREALVGAAFAVIAADGFEGLRTRKVADAVGVNVATLHYYYPDKEALVRAVVEYAVGRLHTVATVRLPAGARRAAPGEELREHVLASLRQMREEPALFLVLSEIGVRAARDPHVARVLASSNGEWFGYLTTLLRAGVDAGALRADLHPEAAAGVIISFLRGAFAQARDANIEAAAHEVLRLLAVSDSSDE